MSGSSVSRRPGRKDRAAMTRKTRTSRGSYTREQERERRRETEPRPSSWTNGGAESSRGMAKLLRCAKGKGVEGLYEGPMLYRLLTWHRAKKGEQEEKEEKEDEEVERRGG